MEFQLAVADRNFIAGNLDTQRERQGIACGFLKSVAVAQRTIGSFELAVERQVVQRPFKFEILDAVNAGYVEVPGQSRFDDRQRCSQLRHVKGINVDLAINWNFFGLEALT